MSWQGTVPTASPPINTNSNGLWLTSLSVYSLCRYQVIRALIPARSPCPRIPPTTIYKLKQNNTDANLLSLVGTGHIDKGAIISAAGDSAWATSVDFQVFPTMMQPSRGAFVALPIDAVCTRTRLTIGIYSQHDSSSPRR